MKQQSQSTYGKEQLEKVTTVTSEVNKFKADEEQRLGKTKAELEQLRRESESEKVRTQGEEKRVADEESRADALSKALCLTAETPIYVKGEMGVQIKPISEVTLKDYVFSCELEQDVCDFRPVVAVFAHYAGDLYQLRFNGDQVINATSDHPFYEVFQGEWKAANELRVGDILYSINGENVELESIEPIPGTYDVYNIEVSENHNYFANGILTHNCDWLEKVGQEVGIKEAEANPLVPVVATGVELVGEAAVAAAEGGIFATTAAAAGNVLYETGNWLYNKIWGGSESADVDDGEGETSEQTDGDKVDRQKKGTSGNNQEQNKQFDDATRGLSKDQKRRIHDEISGQNMSYKEIRELVKEMFGK